MTMRMIKKFALAMLLILAGCRGVQRPMREDAAEPEYNGLVVEECDF